MEDNCRGGQDIFSLCGLVIRYCSGVVFFPSLFCVLVFLSAAHATLEYQRPYGQMWPLGWSPVLAQPPQDSSIATWHQLRVIKKMRRRLVKKPFRTTKKNRNRYLATFKKMPQHLNFFATLLLWNFLRL